MAVTHVRLMLALTAIKLRCRGTINDLQTDVVTMCDDALEGLSMDRSPEDTDRFDSVRVDGEPGFEAEVRRTKPNEKDGDE